MSSAEETSLTNPLNYNLKGLIKKSADKTCVVMKLQHKAFNTMLAAKVYTITDPENTGYAKV